MASGVVKLGRPKNLSRVLSITDSASRRLSQMLSQKPASCIGFRLGLKDRGCTGASYQLDYTDHASKFDEVVKHNDVTIIIDSKALLNIIGSEMDFVEDKMKSEFVFTNPNAKAICGCGESFTTK